MCFAALATNAFGFLRFRAADLPPLPELKRGAWPSHSLAIERTIRFPWCSGCHAVPGCLTATDVAALAIQCKQFEPFRDCGNGGFTGTFRRSL